MQPNPMEMMLMVPTCWGYAMLRSPLAGAFFASQGLSYVSVCGITVKGQRELDEKGT